MALQFDPSPYLQAFQYGQNRDQQKQQLMAQAVQGIGQGIGQLAEIPEKTKQKRWDDVMKFVNARNAGLDPNATQNYVDTGQFPQDKNQQTLTQSAPVSSQPLNSSIDNGPMPSAGQPMPGFTQDTISAWNNHPDLSQFAPQNAPNPAPQKQGFSSLLAPPIDYGKIINDAKGGDFSSFRSLNPSDKANIEKTPQWKHMTDQTMSFDNALNAYGKTIQPFIDNAKQQGKNSLNQTDLNNIGKLLSTQSQQGRGEYYSNKAGQVGVQAVQNIKDQIDPYKLNRTSPMGAAASSVLRVINGASLLNQPIVTKAALEATLGDIDSILTQGAATVEGRKMLQGSNIYNSVANWKSFVSSSPQNVQVPENYKAVYKNILMELGKMNQSRIQQYVQRSASMVRPQALKIMTPEQFDSSVQDVMDQYDIGKQLGNVGTNPGPSSQSSLMWQGKQLKDTPANRAWLATQGGNQ